MEVIEPIILIFDESQFTVDKEIINPKRRKNWENPIIPLVVGFMINPINRIPVNKAAIALSLKCALVTILFLAKRRMNKKTGIDNTITSAIRPISLILELILFKLLTRSKINNSVM